MKRKFRSLSAAVLLFIAFTTLFSGCEKEEWSGIEFWPVGWSTTVPLEFYIDGVRVQPKYPEIVPEHRPGNLFVASEGDQETVAIDFTITYNNQVFTSLQNSNGIPVSPKLVLSADESTAGSEYTITPTGIVSAPWNVTRENDNGGTGSSQYDGNWQRQDVTSYLKISGSSAWLCNGSVEWTGTFSESQQKLVMTADGQTADFDVEISGSTLIVYPGDFSPTHDPATYYSVANYPC